MKSKAKYVITFLVVFIQGGCSTSKPFVCDGIAEGVRCASSREVYEQTHDKDEIRPTKVDDEASFEGYSEDDVNITNTNTTHGSHIQQRPVYPAPPPGPVIPLRTPSGVMRIAVNLWEDKGKRLFSAQYIFTEIEARTWVIGEPYMNNKAPFSPLQSGGLGIAPSGVMTPLR